MQTLHGVYAGLGQKVAGEAGSLMTSMIRRLLNGDDSWFLHFLETGEKLCCVSTTKEGLQCDMMGKPFSEKDFKVYCKKCIYQSKQTGHLPKIKVPRTTPAKKSKTTKVNQSNSMQR